MKTKVLVLLSGGADSTTALHRAVAEGKEVHALTIQTIGGAEGSMDVILAERNVAKLNAQGAGVTHTICDLRPLASLLPDNVIVAVGGQAGGCVPSQKKYAPLSIEMMQLAAGMYCATHGIRHIIWAIHADDITDRKYFERQLYQTEEFIANRCGVDVSIETPFTEKTKAEVMAMGSAFGVDFASTSSCVEDSAIPCGTCHQCQVRQAAEATLSEATCRLVRT